MSHPIEQEQKKYTYKDYLNLPDDQRFEILDGILYMTPAPSTEHQRVLRKLLVHIANYLDGKACEVFNSPYDVLLPEKNEETDKAETIVQPDILVVCDESKITKKHCLGSPDWIIEIVSPSAPSRDYVKKLHLYEKHKIKEYWIVNYIYKEIMVYRLNEGEGYNKPETYIDNAFVMTGIFEDLSINLKDIFE